MQTSKILIMMATYNGEKYLREQLDSIINQTITDWELIIRDDNSLDQTVDIVKEYIARDRRIQLIQNDSDFHGAYYNFFGLINVVRAQEKVYDFYMFADQDDIWDRDKLELLQNFYHEVHTQGPTMIYADMRIIDGKGEETSPSMNHLMGISYTNPITAYMAHKVYGCNTFFNYDLFSILPKIANDAAELVFLSHDNFITKVAALKGNVYFYPETVMGYRRYGSNVTSKHEYNFKMSRILKRLSKINDLAKDHALTYKQSMVAICLLRRQALSDSEQALLDKVENIIQRGGLYAVRMVLSEKIRWGKSAKTISRTVILFSKLYKKYLRDNEKEDK